MLPVRGLYFIAVIAFLSFSFCVKGQQGLYFETQGRKQVMEFKLVKNLIVIPVMINGKGPYNFVLDTGVGIFIITDSTLISNINNLRSIKISGFGEGKEVDAYISNSVPVRIGENIAGNIAAAILKKDAFQLSAYTGMAIHGLLGYEFFNAFIVKIDYLQKMITVYRQDKAYIPRKGTRVPITIDNHKPYLIAEVGLPGETIPVRLIIDTGAGHPISLETNNQLPFTVPAKSIPGNLGVGLMGPIRGAIARIGVLKIGKFELKNVIAAFPDIRDVGSKVTTENRNGNLGNSILKRFFVVFDYSRECVYLRSSYGYKEPFEHDMSGLEINSAGEDFSRVIVSRVEPGSAGDECGLQPDDEILAINFKPVKNMNLQEIDDLFRSRNERSFILDILPKDAKSNERIILTLKRRI